MIGFAAVMIISVIGVTVGAIAGFFGGWIDNLLMRAVDIVLSLPTFFIILMVVGFFGTGNVWVVIIAISITGWTLAARLVRAEFLALETRTTCRPHAPWGRAAAIIVPPHAARGARADRGGRRARRGSWVGRPP